MSYYLGIDTTGVTSSVALLDEGDCLSVRSFEANRACEELFPLLQTMLLENSVAIEELHAIAVCSGPGSFTGVRSSLAVAQGLCFNQGSRGFAIPAFHPSALLAEIVSGHVIAFRTSIREEVYAQCLEYVCTKEGALLVRELSEIFCCPRDELDQRARAILGDSFCSVDIEQQEMPMAEGAALMASGLVSGAILGENYENLEPIYVKPVNAKTIKERAAG